MIKALVAATALAVSLPIMAFAECAEVTQGDITLSGAWSRATVGADRPAVFYVTIRNDGSSDDHLTGITTPVAAMPMLHETVIQDGAARMPHADRIVIPAGDTVSLAPGSYHGMLMELSSALDEGSSFPMTLQFEKAGPIEIKTDVLPIRAREAACAAP
ncbi:copper chaperone PCu(A)C [Paracoccus rhizosphaerae]|uniref:Copper chaperone PCu(A)C n=1 Tax=Paracoccus rhizosphaerae TaxID=1133347 RepID=A0ABV6CNH3_9RHOB|nr:copper chaperone PCu(A)C [Paracoccus rhizosphaerae]